MEYTKLKDGISFGKLSEMIEEVVIPEKYENIKNKIFAGLYPNLKKIVCPSTLKMQVIDIFILIQYKKLYLIMDLK